MPEEGKKSGVFAQIIVAVIIAMCVGGTSPWWYKEVFGRKPEVVPPQVSGQGLVNSEKLSQLNNSDLDKRQKQLEEELANLKRDQQQKTTPARQVRTQANIAGTWQGDGSSYMITQNGNIVAFQEFTQPYGITAGGQGTISGSDITFSVQTAFGTGTLQMTLSDDGDEMTGTYTDAYGNQRPYTITR